MNYTLLRLSACDMNFFSRQKKIFIPDVICRIILDVIRGTFQPFKHAILESRKPAVALKLMKEINEIETPILLRHQVG